MSKGVIYILTNPSFKEYVKIGYADDMNSRLKQLNNSECTPFAFRVYATYEVENRLTDLKLHSLIDKLNPDLRSIDNVEGKKRVREFYAMSPEDAYSLLEAIAEINGTPERLVKWSLSDDDKKAEETAEEIKEKSESATQVKRREYWKAFNDYASENDSFTKEFNTRKPSTDHWMTLYIGSSLAYIDLLQERSRSSLGVELHIPDNKECYKILEEQRETIEKETGIKFEWMELPEKKASRIVAEKEIDFTEPEEWPSQFDWMINTAIKLKIAVKKYL